MKADKNMERMVKAVHPMLKVFHQLKAGKNTVERMVKGIHPVVIHHMVKVFHQSKAGKNRERMARVKGVHPLVADENTERTMLCHYKRALG